MVRVLNLVLKDMSILHFFDKLLFGWSDLFKVGRWPDEIFLFFFLFYI